MTNLVVHSNARLLKLSSLASNESRGGKEETRREIVLRKHCVRKMIIPRRRKRRGVARSLYILY